MIVALCFPAVNTVLKSFLTFFEPSDRYRDLHLSVNVDCLIPYQFNKDRVEIILGIIPVDIFREAVRPHPGVVMTPDKILQIPAPVFEPERRFKVQFLKVFILDHLNGYVLRYLLPCHLFFLLSYAGRRSAHLLLRYNPPRYHRSG